MNLRQFLPLTLPFTLVLASCGRQVFSVMPNSTPLESASATDVAAALPPLNGPFGGADQSRWTAEAVIANAARASLREGMTSGPNREGFPVRDVRVAIPVDLIDSKFSPYGDGQTNSAVSFNGWNAKRPPVVGQLIVYGTGDSTASAKLKITFDRSWNLSQRELEVTLPGRGININLPLKRDSDGNYFVEEAIPDRNVAFHVLGGIQDKGTVEMLYVRPKGSFSDYFALYFRLAQHSQGSFIADIPAQMQRYSDGRTISDPYDSRSVANSVGDAFRALQQRVPLTANGGPYGLYIPENVHAEFGAGGRKTAIGKGYTFVRERSTPFKTMYTCFDARNEGAEAAFGVTSGSGWHVIGDPAITLLNSIERQAMLVATGYTNPADRFPSQNAPSVNISYGLSDVAVFSYLQPGEVFVTSSTVFPDRHQDHQWYAIESTGNSPFCAEEFVHPSRPNGLLPKFR